VAQRRGQSAGVRLVDVARAAGVGASTASRVLNGDPTISIRPETRERIFRAARRLNYRPNAFARGLKLARTMTLGMVIPNLAYPVNAEIIRGAERRAAAAGYVILLADAEEFVQAGEAYQRLLLERRVDGLLIASASTSEELLGELAEHGLPFVLVNRRVPRLGPSVTVDDALGMRLAVEHLVGLGHRRIAPPTPTQPSAALLGFRRGWCGPVLAFTEASSCMPR
jgi:LacI family transcriptional regulator